MTIIRRAMISAGGVLSVLAMGRRADAARAPIASFLRTSPRSDGTRSSCIQMAYGQFNSPPCRRSSPCIFEGSCGFRGGSE